MSEANLKLALDIGTTTLAGRLLAPDGASVAEAQVRNPQAELGSDVIRRLEAALDGHAERLRDLLVEGLRALVAELFGRAGVAAPDVTAAAAAGNPAMSFLLRRLPPRQILFPPHRPADPSAVWLPAHELDLGLRTPLYLFPLVSGYVGGDLVAAVFSLAEAPQGTLLIDIGTNAEMALRTGQGWLATSVAAGSAFEGAGIRCGMLAAPGAIEAVALEGDSLRLATVAGLSPRGLCGSGVVSALAAARTAGLLDRHGTLVDPGSVETNLARYLVDSGQGRALRLYRDASVEILLNQDDVRQFQLAKGAVRAGIECLLDRAEDGGAVRLVVTGAFGLHLPADALKTVAMLPEGMIESERFIPDGVLAGLSLALTHEGGLQAVEALARRIRPYPLSGTPAFERAFLEGMNF